MSESFESKKTFTLHDAYTTAARPDGPLLLVWVERAEHAFQQVSHERVWTADILLSHLPLLLRRENAAKLGFVFKCRVLHAAVALSARERMPEGLYPLLYEFAHSAGASIFQANGRPNPDSRALAEYLTGLLKLATAENVPTPSDGSSLSAIRQKFLQDIMSFSEALAKYNPGLLIESNSIPFANEMERLFSSESRKEDDLALKTQSVRILSRLHGVLRIKPEPRKGSISANAAELMEFTVGDLADTLEEEFRAEEEKNKQKLSEREIRRTNSTFMGLENKIKELNVSQETNKMKLKATQDEQEKKQKKLEKKQKNLAKLKKKCTIFDMPIGKMRELNEKIGRLNQEFERLNWDIVHIKDRISRESLQIQNLTESVQNGRQLQQSIQSDMSLPSELKFDSKTLCAALIRQFASDKFSTDSTGIGGKELPSVDLLLPYVERCYNYVQRYGFEPQPKIRNRYSDFGVVEKNERQSERSDAPFDRRKGEEIADLYRMFKFAAPNLVGMPFSELFLEVGYSKQRFEPELVHAPKNLMQDKALECVEKALFANYSQTKYILEQLAQTNDAAKTNGEGSEQAIHAKTLSILAKNPIQAAQDSQLLPIKPAAEKEVLGGRSIYEAKSGDKIDLNRIPGWTPKGAPKPEKKHSPFSGMRNSYRW